MMISVFYRRHDSTVTSRWGYGPVSRAAVCRAGDLYSQPVGVIYQVVDLNLHIKFEIPGTNSLRIFRKTLSKINWFFERFKPMNHIN